MGRVRSNVMPWSASKLTGAIVPVATVLYCRTGSKWSYVHCSWPWFGPFSLRHLFTLIEKQTAQIDQLAELVVRHLEGGEVGG